MTSSLRHNDVITVEFWIFMKYCRSKLEKFKHVSDFKKRQISDRNRKENFLFNTNNSLLKNLSCT